ncbi:hypothetical protein A6R68_16869, partial [Neotoma lepida]
MDEREDNDAEAWLKLKPVEPLPSQCCGSGCSPCVFDLYYRDLERWEAAQARNDRSLLNGKQSPETQGCSTKLSPETFLAFHISAMEKLTKDTYRVRGIVNGLEIQRAYTPISPVTAEGYFDVLIKYGELLMLAAGTGLAPMVPILQSITDNADDETFVTLVGCFKTFENIYLKTFLQEQAKFWNVRTFFVLSQEVSPEQLPWSYREKTHFGRLGQELVDELVACCRRKPFTLVCGSPAFTEDMTRGPRINAWRMTLRKAQSSLEDLNFRTFCGLNLTC